MEFIATWPVIEFPKWADRGLSTHTYNPADQVKVSNSSEEKWKIHVC